MKLKRSCVSMEMVVFCDDCRHVYDSMKHEECPECECETATECDEISIECLDCGTVHSDQYQLIDSDDGLVCKSCFKPDLEAVETEEGW